MYMYIVSVPGATSDTICPRLIVNGTTHGTLFLLHQQNTFDDVSAPVYAAALFPQPVFLYYNASWGSWLLSKDTHGRDVIVNMTGRQGYVPYGEWNSAHGVITILCQGNSIALFVNVIFLPARLRLD